VTDLLRHTYHPNTFGLLYGRTTKTACSKRRRTPLLVKPEKTTCPGCKATWQRHYDELRAMAESLRELGYMNGEPASEHVCPDPVYGPCPYPPCGKGAR
jgi:hypothetical protein